jgi:hypothetical protein
MRLIKISLFLLVALCGWHGSILAQNAGDYRLKFREGDIRRVVITEVLRLHFHFEQVDSADAHPSIRTSNYYYTQTVQKVLPNGDAVIGSTLDSFQTGITVGEQKNAEVFFKFNSNGSWDIQHEFHDIRILPRAQFLGNTLKFTMRPDGTIANFINLQDFHDNAIGRGYDYDMVHAMLSLTDTLRMGQLLEFGFGGLAAVGKEYVSPSTATEIPITRSVAAAQNGKGSLSVRVSYDNPPQKIDYLEGIAMPLGIVSFNGGGSGEIDFKDGFLKHSVFRDTANVVLSVDVDTVPEEITRTVTTDVYAIPVLHGGTISIKEIKSHRAPPKDLNKDQNPADSTTSQQPGQDPSETREEK